MDSREAAGVLAQCKWLRDNIKTWEDAAKLVLALELRAGERTAAIAPDGCELGAVTMTKGARSMRIDNEAGFLAWVQMRYPTEVEQTVRPAFVKLCAEKVKKLGVLPDANGELCPHVSLVEDDPHLMTKLNEMADLMIRESILQNKLMEVLTPPSELPTPVVDVDLGDLPTTPPWVTYVDADPPVTQGDSAIAGAVHEVQEWTEQPPDLNDEQVGPPHWGESNTFETSDAVRQHREP